MGACGSEKREDGSKMRKTVSPAVLLVVIIVLLCVIVYVYWSATGSKVTKAVREKGSAELEKKKGTRIERRQKGLRAPRGGGAEEAAPVAGGGQ